MYSKIKIKLSALVLAFCLVAPLQAGSLKKVLVLDFANLESKSEYKYLQTSVANAVKKSLAKRFAFEETKEEEWEEVAEANFLYKDELHTKSAAMNLGLLSKQDVVISGSFRIQAGTAGGSDTLVIDVRLFDIPRKKIVSETRFESELNARLFQSVENIANKIAEAAKEVLPTKEQWSKTGISDVSEPFFDNPVLGLRLGGAFYAAGYADRFESSQPSFGAMFRTRLPKLSKHLHFAVNLNYVRHAWQRDFNSVTKTSEIETNNYLVGGYLGFELQLFRKFSLLPKLVGGYVMQDTQITGQVNESASNFIPFAGAGVEFAYSTSSSTSIILDLTSAAEMESGQVTLLNTVQLGVNFHL